MLSAELKLTAQATRRRNYPLMTAEKAVHNESPFCLEVFIVIAAFDPKPETDVGDIYVAHRQKVKGKD